MSKSAVIESFRTMWSSEDKADLLQFITSQTVQDEETIIQLVMVDQEFRLRHNVSWSVQEYVQSIPRLASDDQRLLPLALNEYRLRESKGDSISPSLFAQRFPFAKELEQAIDASRDLETMAESSSSEGTWPKGGGTSSQEFDQRYHLLQRIGGGAFGEVFAARDLLLDRKVAIKFLQGTEWDQDLRTRVLDEARAIAAVKHPHLVSVFDTGECDGDKAYIVMEFIGGNTLADVLAAGNADPLRLVGYVEQCAQGLAEAHRNGVIHRDIKPSNILIDENDRPRIVDFGVSLSSGSANVEGLAGTPAYMSPEQANAERTIDEQTDVWALGVILYQATVKQLPFQGDLQSTLKQIREFQGYKDSSLAGLGLPPAIGKILQKCLQPDRKSRYQSAGEVALEIGRETRLPWWRGITNLWVCFALVALSAPLALLAGLFAWSLSDSLIFLASAQQFFETVLGFLIVGLPLLLSATLMLALAILGIRLRLKHRSNLASWLERTHPAALIAAVLSPTSLFLGWLTIVPVTLLGVWSLWAKGTRKTWLSSLRYVVLALAMCVPGYFSTNMLVQFIRQSHSGFVHRDNAREAMRAGNVEDAINEYTESVHYQPALLYSHGERGVLLFQTAEYQRAKLDLTAELEAAEQAADSLTMTGTNEWKMLLNRRSEWFAFRGLCEEKLGNAEQAESDLNAARKINPQMVEQILADHR